MGKFTDYIRGKALNFLIPGGYDFMDPGNGGATIERRYQMADAYYSNAFRACELAKARPLAALPIHVYERRDGVRAESSKRFSKRLSTLLRTRWNPFTSASEGIRWALMTKDILGNAFMRIQFDSAGMPVAIYPMSREPTVRTDGLNPVFVYGGDKFTAPGTYLSHEIVWLKSPILDSDGLWGRSLAELAASELGLSIDLESFYSNILNGEANFPGWLETDQTLKPQDVADLRDQLEKRGGIVQAGAIRVFDKGLSYKSTGQSIVDMSLVDQEKWILQQTCRTLSVPPQEVYDLSHATYSNVEQGALDFANKSLMPECNELERAFSSILWAAGYTDCYAQFDMNGLLRGSYRERMEGYRIGIYGGFMNPNEARAKEDMAPYEGGDEFLRSTAYSTIDPETGEVEPPATANMSGVGGSGEGIGPERIDQPDKGNAAAKGTALAVIHHDMRERIRDRVSSGGDSAKTREFAKKVLTPLAVAYEVDGIQYDLESDIEEIING